MNKRRIIVSIIFSLLLLSITTELMHTKAVFNNINLLKTTKSSITPSNQFQIQAAPSDMEKVQSNVFPNGCFETNESDGSPTSIARTGTGYSYFNYSYQDEVHEGAYGAYLSAQGTPQNWAYMYCLRQITSWSSQYSYLDENISLDFWFNIKANPSAYGQIVLTLYLTTIQGTYYMYYYLAANTVSQVNSTNSAHYDVRGSINTWIHLERNVTNDLILAVSSVPDLSTAYINNFQITITSPSENSGPTILLIDEVEIVNGTGYNYCFDNGDFEAGDGHAWAGTAYGPASVLRTTIDKTQGTSAMIMTAQTHQQSLYSYTRAYKTTYDFYNTMPKGYPTYQPGDLELSFDWKYSDTEDGVGDQQAYFYFEAQNQSYTTSIYYILGDENDDINSYFNSTMAPNFYYYFAAPNLGSRDSWNHFAIDVYTILDSLNLRNMVLSRVNFYVNVYGYNQTVQLLVDDLKITTYPAGDPGFEGYFGYSPADPIRLWQTVNNEYYTNITTDAYTGNYAANISSYNNLGLRYAFRYTHLPVTNNLFTDMWWRLDKLSSSSLGAAYSTIRLQLEDGDFIYYILASNGGISFTNSSSLCYYIVDELNQTGVWTNLFRNVTRDVEYFGVENNNITEILIGSHSNVAAETITIFDDIHFIKDTTGPTLTNLEVNPISPQYFDDVIISIEATDNIALESIDLYYSINHGTWLSTPMTPNNDTFEFTIPAQAYETTVTYYIEAVDIYGYETTLGTINTPLTYIVNDFIDPLLYITDAPLQNESLSGNVLFILDAEDIGSGIAYFEIRIDDIIVLNNTLPPMQFTWSTEIYENGEHAISFYLWDGAGNNMESHLSYDIYNPPTQWEAFTVFMQKWGPYIGGGAGGLAIIVVVLVVIIRKKRV